MPRSEPRSAPHPEPARYDLAVIGGGINGAGIARDAAGRGFRVLLVEQGDLASGTSSASTKLIHGGLRYLEQGAIRLVRESLAEREVLLRLAPHIVRPLRFVLPPQPEGRAPLLLWLGLFLYDRLGGRRILPASRRLDLTRDPAGAPLRRGSGSAFAYSDCMVDDARLVVLNALDAAERRACIRTRTRCVRAGRETVWHLDLDDGTRRETVTARVLVNAAGPWAGIVARDLLGERAPAPLRLVKGSHIVVPRLFAHEDAYLFQNADGRVVFALPFAGRFTLIGTTDVDFSGDPADAAASAAEIDYLCRAASAQLRDPVTPADVVWSFAGVRALYDDGSARLQDITRDYHLDLDRAEGRAPLLTLYGGKITTYRRLAEAVLSALAPVLGHRAAWTAQAALPGGDFPPEALDAHIAQARRTWPFLAEAQADRLFRAYGTRLERVLGDAKRPENLGPRFGADLTAAELRYLMAQEFAREADDVLWRRTRLGLRLGAEERAALAAFMADQRRT